MALDTTCGISNDYAISLLRKWLFNPSFRKYLLLFLNLLTPACPCCMLYPAFINNISYTLSPDPDIPKIQIPAGKIVTKIYNEIIVNFFKTQL